MTQLSKFELYLLRLAMNKRTRQVLLCLAFTFLLVLTFRFRPTTPVLGAKSIGTTFTYLPFVAKQVPLPARLVLFEAFMNPV